MTTTDSERLTYFYLRKTNLPRQYWDATFADYQVDDDNQDMFNAAVDWTEAYLEYRLQRPGKGLLLLGPTGVGKTRLVATAGCHLVRSRDVAPWSPEADFNVQYLTLAEYTRRSLEQFKLHDAWAKADDGAAYRRWSEWEALVQGLFESTNVLILDDVGQEHATSSGFSGDQFTDLLRSRESRELPTLMTSNMPVSEWSDTYGSSMGSFIHQACTVVAAPKARDRR